MNLADITTKPWILALFKRDDGERFLLGDGYYDFKDSLQHFQPNSMSNDIVELQGADGQLLAGQVRRSGTQSFDGYIGDGTTNRKIVEQRRKAFLMFFRKKHYYTVVYIFCEGTAIKRERGYLVDAPSVPEIRQKSPEYHVALNFENVNYYEYAENSQGDEIYSNVREIVVSNIISGGLVWDALGAVSDAIQWGAYTTESGSFITLNDVIQNAPMSLTQIKGNAEQNGTPTPDAPIAIDVVTGEQTVGVTGKNLQSTTWGQDFVDAINDASKASVQTYDGKNCLKYVPSAGYGSYPTKNFTLGIRFHPNTQYTFSFDMLKTNASARTFAIWYSDGTTTTTNAGDAGADEWHHYEITSTAGKTVVYATPFYTTGDAYIDIDTFQIEIGTSATQFVPYYGQKFEINLGKNLTDLSTFTFGYVTATGEINTSHPMGEMVSPFIKVNPNTAYTFKIFETTGTNQGWFGVGEYTSESTSSFVRRDTTGTTTAIFYTFTTSATTNYIRVSARNLEQATKVQLEKGSTSTSWAEYFTPIELAKIGTYKDRIYKDDDKWYIEKQVGKVVLESSDVGIYGSYAHIDYASLTKPADSFMYGNYDSPVGKTISSCAIPSTLSGSFDQATYVGKLLSQPALNRFWIGFAKGTVLTDMKNTLDGQTVYYALATPTSTEITDATLLEQLEHIYQLYGGLNNISLVGAGNGSIEISYATELNPGGGLVWEDGGTGGLTTITIDAVDLTLPVWTITGPATNPTLSNITTGQTMSWLGTVPSGQTLIIDMNEQTATMAGANVYAFLSGNWVGLAPGTNRISYSVTGTDEASTLSWNNIVG